MRRPLLGACLLFILCIGIYYLCVPPDLPDYKDFQNKELYVSGTVTAIRTRESFGKTQIIYTLKDTSLKESRADACNKRYKHNQIYCNTSEYYEKTYIGSHIIVKGVFLPFEEAKNPGEFNSQFYYHILGVGATLKDTELISSDGAISYLAQLLHQIHTYLLTKTEQLFSQPYTGIIQAVLFGYKENLDKETKSLYQEGGMLHIMTISGMHISMLGMGFVRLLEKLRVPVKVRAVIGISVVILYGKMVGMQASAFRAVCMFSLQMLAKIKGRTYDSLTALGVSAVLLLLKQPLYLMSSSFWLSYGAVCGIVIVSPILSKWCHTTPNRAKKIVGRLSVSAGILLVTLPIQLYFFYEYPLYSVVVNLIVLPLLPFVVGFAVLGLALPWNPFGLRHVFVVLTQIILWFYEKVSALFQTLPYHAIVAGAPKWWQMVLYYICLTFCLLAIQKRTAFPRFSKQICFVSVAVLSSALLVLFWRPLNGFACHFLSVGQGDCAVVQCDGRTYLVDCGSANQKSVAKDVLLPFFKYYGIKEIDGVFLSHADKDHISGVSEWLTTYEHSHITINNLILPNLGKEVLQEEFAELLSLASTQNIPIHTVSAGDDIPLGDLQIQVLNPAFSYGQDAAHDTAESTQTDSNESSQVLLLEYKGYHILMMGDVSAKTEEALLSKLDGKHIHVLKVAHHGSKYSSSESFLAQIRPALSILSYGEGNRYGHPHEEVLKRLERAGSIILETPKSGCITVAITSGGFKIKQFITCRQLK